MARQRDLLVNVERMRQEIDDLLGEGGWGRSRASAGRQTGFSPRVDVYYCADPPRAVVKAELAGVSIDAVALEISGRKLVIAGGRPVRETEGRVYQQLEIEAGPFRRVVELGADVVAEAARATYEDGILRVELPLRRAGEGAHRVPIDSPDA